MKTRHVLWIVATLFIAGITGAVTINTSARCPVGSVCDVGDANTGSVALVTDGAKLTIESTNTATLTSTTTTSPTFIGADAATPANTIFDTTGAGTVQTGSADVTAVTMVTDGASVNLEGTTANTLTLTAATTGSAIFQGADAAAPANTIFDTTGIGTVQLGSADVTGATIVTDGSSLDVETTAATIIATTQELEIDGLATGTTSLIFKDFDATAGDDNASIVVECSDASDTNEDCNVVMSSQVDGTPTAFLSIDADGITALGSSAATSMALTTDGGVVTIDGSIASNANDLAWAVVAGANTACTTTCTSACVVGFDDGAADVENMVDCADATADKCLCAGAS